MDTTPFAARRRLLLQRLGDGIAVIPTAPEQVRNRDTTYPYRADSYFQYLTGFTEPEAALVLLGGNEGRAILFCRERDPDKEIWDGYRYGPEGAREVFGFDEAMPIGQFDQKLPELMANRPGLWYSLGHDAAWDARITAALNAVRAQVRAGKRAPATVHDVRAALDEMRLIKDAHEIGIMRRAATVAAGAHVRAMGLAAPGRYEYEVEAEFLHEFRRHGSEYPAYPPIVASGANACVLHYVGNDRQMQAGELLLIDAGCEIRGYASDITRTFPVSGRFAGPQEDVYELVEAAQQAAIAAVRPGSRFIDPHEAAVRVLAQGMLDLKLLHGSLDGLIESEGYKRFYMHRTSHWLGLDVHDAGDYKDGEAWKTLVPGMMLTVEPGCYIRPADDVPKAFWNIGVRIEDDALVTAEGCEIITAAAPKKVADIEALMAAAGGR
ncbi:MAG TPA: aminopeptidase P N-terminal domain-containing protein [Rhodocyclaceae bacterium]|nr:aminopeptidase P N-terminal domain-containing protein [Rhodocyclaceae bacterium]